MTDRFGDIRAVRNSDLPSTDKLVLHTVLTYAGPHGSAWPSIARLADDCSLSRRATQQALARLRDADILLAPSGTSHGRTPTRYLFLRHNLPRRTRSRNTPD